MYVSYVSVISGNRSRGNLLSLFSAIDKLSLTTKSSFRKALLIVRLLLSFLIKSAPCDKEKPTMTPIIVKVEVQGNSLNLVFHESVFDASFGIVYYFAYMPFDSPDYFY